MHYESSPIKCNLTLYYYFVIIMIFTFIRHSSLPETECGERGWSE